MKNNAEATLSGYKGTFINGLIEDIETDVVIATQWDTVYHAKKIDGYKMYFVHLLLYFLQKLTQVNCNEKI